MEGPMCSKTLKSALLALLVVLVHPAVAGGCKSQEEILKELATKHGETLWGSGEIGENNRVFTAYFLKGGWELRAGDRLSIISNPLGHTWTFAVQKEGASDLCVVAQGTHTELAPQGDALEFEGTSGFKFWFTKNPKSGEWLLRAAWAGTPIDDHATVSGNKWDLAPPHVRWQLKGPKI